jgi:hypothetical protein
VTPTERGPDGMFEKIKGCEVVEPTLSTTTDSRAGGEKLKSPFAVSIL